MPSGMFGAPIGVSQAEADNRAAELHQLAMGEGAVKLEQAQIALASQKKMLQLMQQQLGPGTIPQSPENRMMSVTAGDDTERLASSLDMMANLSMQSGNPAQAKDFAVAGSTLRHQSAEIQKSKTSQMITELNLIGSLMDNVHDQGSWQQANAMYQMQTGKASPYARLPYNPQMVQELRQGIMSAKDRALTAAAEARTKASEAVEAERRARVPLIRAQTQLAQERTTALQKVGAVTKIPKAGDIKAITDLMVKDFGGAVMPEDARVLARPVAERMMEIMKTQNLPQSQAAVKAYEEAKAAGDFGGIRPRVQMAGSAAKPLDLPVDSKGQLDKSKMKPNMYYNGIGKYTGKTMLWTGVTFVPVGTGPGEVQPQDEELDEDDEDDEDAEGEARGDYEEAQ